MDAPTSSGMMGSVSGTARSSQRKVLSTGTALCTTGSQPYSSWDRSARFSGLDGNTRMRAQ